jgi:hypothetical protein
LNHLPPVADGAFGRDPKADGLRGGCAVRELANGWAGGHNGHVKTRSIRLLLLLLVAGFRHGAAASPAPAPLLQSPASGALNVDPDTTLSWRWVDDLMANGSFESGMTPGWYTGGANPDIWQIFTSATNAWGMGYRWAGTQSPYYVSPANGQLIQDLYIPADAVSATLQWSERIINLQPYVPMARLRVMLFQGGSWVTTLEDALGSEPIFMSRNWVTRSTNLLAYAGQSLQLVVQANSYYPQAATMWWADVDGFSFTCENASATPEFQVLLGKSSVLRATNQVGDTTALSLVAPPLDSSMTYYWRVGAVRDGVTNLSTTAHFKTGQRVLPAVTVAGVTDTGVRLSFPTRAGRNYIIEQRDGLDGTTGWYDILWVGQGTGTPMEVEVPLPWNGTAYWRLRVSP